MTEHDRVRYPEELANMLVPSSHGLWSEDLDFVSFHDGRATVERKKQFLPKAEDPESDKEHNAGYNAWAKSQNAEPHPVRDLSGEFPGIEDGDSWYDDSNCLSGDRKTLLVPLQVEDEAGGRGQADGMFDLLREYFLGRCEIIGGYFGASTPSIDIVRPISSTKNQGMVPWTEVWEIGLLCPCNHVWSPDGSFDP